MDSSTSSELLAHISNVDHPIQPQETEIMTFMDRQLYVAATRGNASVFAEKKQHLDQLLTPGKNTILHIYINYRNDGDNDDDDDENTMTPDFVDEILGMCPALLMQPNNRGDTLLHFAARHGDIPVVNILIKHAKNLIADNESGVRGVVEQMLRMKNKQGDTALHVAVRLYHNKTAKVLTQEDNEIICYRNEAGETPLYLAIKGLEYDFFYEMFNKCESQTTAYATPKGRTLLHEAVMRDNIGMTKTIITKRRDLCKEADGVVGWVPLHYAAHRGNVSIIKVLLECDPQTAYIRDKNGLIPLQVGVSLTARTIKEIISHCPDCYELVDDIKYDTGVYQVSTAPLIPKSLKKKFHMVKFMIRHLRNKDDVVPSPKFRRENERALRISCETFRNPFATQKGRSITSQVDKARAETLVVAALIATVTFAAGFTLPGGYVSDKGKDQGTAVLKKNTAFKAFVIMDTIAMVLSTCAVFIHLFLSLNQNRKKDLKFFVVAFYLILSAMTAMVIAFMTGIFAVLGVSNALAIATCVIISTYFCLIFGLVTDEYNIS